MATLTGIKDYQYGLEKIFPEADDFLPLLGTDYVELYVGNAKQAAHFYKTAFGFQSLQPLDLILKGVECESNLHPVEMNRLDQG